jgi:2-hydroxychromene-2-carboxylate isomerase
MCRRCDGKCDGRYDGGKLLNAAPRYILRLPTQSLRVQLRFMLRREPAKSLEFFFDYSCPYAYLGHSKLAQLGATMGLRPRYTPMFLGGVFRNNGTPLALMNELSPAKTAHNVADMNRWAMLFGVALRPPATHPQNTALALRVTLVTECLPELVAALYAAYWVDGKDLSCEATLSATIHGLGLEAASVLRRAKEQETRQRLREQTERAIALGVFGAPSYLVDGEHLYWGQDRMFFVADTPYIFASDPGTAVQPEAAVSNPEHLVSHTEQAILKHTIDIYWDFSSPYAYFGATQAEALAERTGANLRWKPMLLGGVFRVLGQPDVPLATFSAAKQTYLALDMDRWARYWNVPFQMPANFPVNTVKALRAYLVLPESRRKAFRDATFHAYWALGSDISSDAVLRELLGAEGDLILQRTQDPAIKQELIACTDAAVAAHVFGAPTWVVNGSELFWGQDRIALVEQYLLGLSRSEAKPQASGLFGER